MFIDTPSNNPQRFPASTLTTGFVAPTTRDSIVEYLAFCNTDSSDRTVSVQDGNSADFLALETVTTGKMTDFPIPDGGLFFQGGFKWKASVGSKVIAWVRFRHV